MAWSCAAITNGMCFYSNGTISPCCMIDSSYRKPIERAGDDPFADLKTGEPPEVCRICHNNEKLGIHSYRESFNQRKKDQPGLQFVDIRNRNLCNAACRTCGPYNSSQWAEEMGQMPPFAHADLTSVKPLIITPSLQSIYYTGGEPFINAEHWSLLEELIDRGISQSISLQYNSNLSTLKFKNKNILDLWKNFYHVSVTASIDAIGEKFNYLRSGLDWHTVNDNLLEMSRYPGVKVRIGTTVSILNLWFVAELLEYYRGKCPVDLTDLHFPNYLSLTSIPDELRPLSLRYLDKIESLYHDKNKINFYRGQVNNNATKHLFTYTVGHVLLLDHLRNEKLFDLLPFRDAAKKQIFYE